MTQYEIDAAMPEQLVSSDQSAQKLFCVVQIKKSGDITSVNGVRMLLTDASVLADTFNAARPTVGAHSNVSKFREERVYIGTAVESAIRKVLLQKENQMKRWEQDEEMLVKENRELKQKIAEFEAKEKEREEKERVEKEKEKKISDAKAALEIAKQKAATLEEMLAN